MNEFYELLIAIEKEIGDDIFLTVRAGTRALIFRFAWLEKGITKKDVNIRISLELFNHLNTNLKDYIMVNFRKAQQEGK